MTSSTQMTPTAARPWHRQLLADAAYLLTGFPLAVISFTVLVSLIATGASLLITLVGLPVLVLACWLARVFAHVERRRVARLDQSAPTTAAYSKARRGVVGMFDIVRDRQAWRDVAHGLIALPATCVTWSIAVAWSATAVLALIWPLVGDSLDGTEGQRHAKDVPNWLGVHGSTGRSVLYVAAGAFCLITLPWVFRGLATVQARFSRTLLGASTQRLLTPRSQPALTTR